MPNQQQKGIKFKPAKLFFIGFFGLLLLPSQITTSVNGIFSTKKSHAKTKPVSDSKKSPIYLFTSVMWEGNHIKPHNIKSLKQIRSRFPGLSMIHFINPAYFTKPNANPVQINALIKSTIKVNDEIGLHLYPWHSITKEAGVIFKNGPTFWGNKIGINQCRIDCGGDVPVSIYREKELIKIIGTSMSLLKKNNYRTPKILLAGGWLAPQHVLEAAAYHGIKFDFSAIAPALVKRRLENYPLYGWLLETWKDTTPLTQPYRISTKYQEIVEMGATTALVDYMDARETLDLFKTILAKKRSSPDLALTFHITIHQETAAQFAPRMVRILEEIFHLAEKNNINLVPLSLPGQGRKVSSEMSHGKISGVAH